MIINNNAVKMESNIEPTKALNFGISDVRLVIDILSKLYAYPIRTLVQEYICNGRDAMREAGTWGKHPIEITLPTTLDPVFKVRDYGVGITPDRMENVFINYGSSTKRNTNTQTGGFGIGAKSAFSYTDSFTITSFIAGKKLTYVSHLADNGGVNLISQESTKELNGVEISIGVKTKDINEFHDAVQRCVRFWQEPIKFIGSRNILQLKPVLTLGNMTVYENSYESRTIFLIDGIEYDMMENNAVAYYRRSSETQLNSSSFIVAINVNNGYFKIASSRERLENNDQNKTYQDKILSDCRNKLQQIVLNKINNESLSLEERIKNKKTYSCFCSIDMVDIKLDSLYSLEKDTVFCPHEIPYRHVRRGRRGSTHFELNKSRKINLNTLVYSSTDNSSTLARKLNYYLESNRDKVLVNVSDIINIPFQNILFTNRLDADGLPLPPKKTSQRTQKSMRHATCWSIGSSGTKSKMTIEELNKKGSPVVFVDEISDEARQLSNFMNVVIVPKCNKHLVLKKNMTVEQGKKYLLSKFKDHVAGLNNLPEGWQSINVLKKFKRNTASDSMQRYLFANFPELKAEHDAMESEFRSITKKYPLINVLNCLLPYDKGASIKIVIDVINQQSKED